MLKRYDLKDTCPIELSLLLMGARYKAIIVIELLGGKKRFSELKNAISGVSQKVLTQHLRLMEEHKLIERKVFAEVPPRVEYSLTETGKSLESVINTMIEWGDDYKKTFLTKK